MHSHLHQNQNQCMEQPNCMMSNGPNPPRPGPEEIPMGDVSVPPSVCPSVVVTRSAALFQMHQCLLIK